MATEYLSIPFTPSYEPSDMAPVTLATVFHVMTPGTKIKGVRFYRHADAAGINDPGQTFAAMIFEEGNQTAVRYKEVVGTVAGWNEVIFDTPLDVPDLNLGFFAAYHTPLGRYSYESQKFGSTGYYSPSGALYSPQSGETVNGWTQNNGQFQYNDIPKYPEGSFGNTFYGVEPIAELPGGATASGSAAQTIPALGQGASGLVRIAGDPYWANVVLLAGFDGAQGSTSYTEESSYGRVATFAGGAAISTSGPLADTGSLLLDGVDDFVSFPDDDVWRLGGSTGTQPWTIEFDLSMPPGTLGDSLTHHILGQLDNATNNRSWGISKASNNAFNIALSLTGNATTLLSLGTVSGMTADTRYRYAIASDGTSIRSYRNGVFQAKIAVPGVLFNSTAPLWLGRSGTGQYAPGKLDEVRITVGVARYTTETSYPPTTFARGAVSAAVNGAASQTLTLTQAALATALVAGSSAQALALAQSATAAARIGAQATHSFVVTAAAAGTVVVQGSSAQSVVIGSLATGFVVDLVTTGSAAQNLAVTSVASAVALVKGQGAQAPVLNQSAAATVRVAASAAHSLAVASSAQGTVRDPIRIVATAQTLPAVTQAATGTVTVQAAGAQVLDLTHAGTVRVVIAGQAAQRVALVSAGIAGHGARTPVPTLHGSRGHRALAGQEQRQSFIGRSGRAVLTGKRPRE